MENHHFWSGDTSSFTVLFRYFVLLVFWGVFFSNSEQLVGKIFGIGFWLGDFGWPVQYKHVRETKVCVDESNTMLLSGGED